VSGSEQFHSAFSIPGLKLTLSNDLSEATG